MGNVIIGERLGKRIKEMGYTQQKFADMMGIKVDTLISYINGRSAYNYELLIEFAERLDCSYDYLLGYSLSPKREYHEIAEQTRLSEKAIEKITSNAKDYDEYFYAKRFIMCLDMIICEEGVFSSICDYIQSSQNTDRINKKVIEAIKDKFRGLPEIREEDIEENTSISLETQYLSNMVSRLKGMKEKIRPEFKEELGVLDMSIFE